MDNINKIHIGDNSINKLFFASPITGKHGDALWSYYKYSNDAGGYYVHGLWLTIVNVFFGFVFGIACHLSSFGNREFCSYYH